MIVRTFLLALLLFLLDASAYADCLQWVCSKDKTQCMCIVEERQRDKPIPDRFNPWPPEFEDRYNPRRKY